ncbi:MAG TPA: potassium transporter TrkG [Candidatus Omnitrophota bacterium]|nr:potassium transporter TrkG [Candidatus Omnitrophota bacterium]
MSLSRYFQAFALFFRRINPVQTLTLGYLLMTLIGWSLLSLPWLQAIPTQTIDNLFTAASAISTTGLTSVSLSDHYNFGGELLVFILIQMGGLGYMIFGSFIVLITRKKISKTHEELLRTDFGLPKSFDFRGFVQTVLLFTLLVEVLGAAGLYMIFKERGIPDPLWNAVFHSVSAFCTAGFSLFNNSFEGFRDHIALNLIIIGLSFAGAIGFIAIVDVWERVTGRKKEITFTSKVILGFSLLTITAGCVLLFFTEPLFKELPNQIWMTALFQSMTAMTTVGFNTVPIGSLSHGALYLMTILMIVGASPAGTGGGIKSTTVVAVLAETFATLRGRRVVTFMGRVIPDFRLQQASASFNFYILLLTAGVYLLTITDSSLSVFELLFEATSAIGTVGLSTGITGALSFAGKCVVIALMVLGRIGPLSIGLALFYSKKDYDDSLWDAKYEDISID